MEKRVYSGPDVGNYTLGDFNRFADGIASDGLARLISRHNKLSFPPFEDVIFFVEQGVVLRYRNDGHEHNANVTVDLFGPSQESVSVVEEILRETGLSP